MSRFLFYIYVVVANLSDLLIMVFKSDFAKEGSYRYIVTNDLLVGNNLH